jgi:zinc/manganese transport system substrate-binding protein
VALALAALAVTALAGCGSGDESSSTPTIVVTTPMLGSLVSDLVGDTAEVKVLMPNGADPHEYQPSAKDIEALGRADLVVENGLKLEEGLEDALAQARDDGAKVFTATDHVTLRPFGADDAADIAEHGPDDPHIWTSPIAMREMVGGLSQTLRSELGLDVAARATDLEAQLTALDAQITTTLAPIPQDRRKLVTGHESLGYFAQRYNFALIGALIPSLSSQAQVSASNLAALREQVTAEGVPAIFNEVGTPEGVAKAIAEQTGVPVVEIATHTLPDDGSYFTFMRDMAAAVSRGLDPPAGG